MKKAILLFAILFSCAAISKASVRMPADSAKDAEKLSKKMKSLQDDLADYKSQLSKVQSQVPTDSVALVNATAKSKDALADSKKAASTAVTGDLSDAKKAERKAKEAADASDDQHDAQKRLNSDRKSVEKLLKKIEKTQKKLDGLQKG